YSSNGGSTFTTYYYLRNAQNDIVKIIDGSGNTVVQYTYDSWGKPISVTGTLASTLGVNQPFRYRGYVYDTETGWYYLQSRYYDPSIYRFISADVYLSTDQGVLGHNTFVYCLNNPVILVDRQGDSATIVIGGATISFVNFVVLVVCLAIIVDLIINQEDALIIQFLTVLSEGVVNSADAILATWDSVVMSNGKVKAADDPDPYARPDQKKQGRERKNKARLDPKWKPRSQPRPPKKHTPSRSHRKYAYIIIFEEEA
ncbi:MAG: RHS repeat-associated core domain-containing protein, partial [Clostridia bacterium]|nr:RHS repeat-associated core domain-containing protein [Clostridia bacterium]